MPERPQLMESAVLVPVYRDESRAVRIVIVRRSEGGSHGGHLAFPGGKRTPQDRTLLDTAVRETEEEIGLDPRASTILEHLPAVETRATGFRIFPFLARIRRPTEWKPDPREIAEVLEVSLSSLTAPGAHGLDTVRFAGEEVPFYRVGRDRLWGASYRILEPLLPRLESGAWDI